MTDARTQLKTRILLRAALPVAKVALAEDPIIKRLVARKSGTVQFMAKNGATPVGAAWVFTDGALSVEQGVREESDVTLRFASPEKLNAFLGGQPVLPRIKGLRHLGLLLCTVPLLLKLKLLLPNARPTDPLNKRLKVKMSMYMITTALSQYNKGGDEEMVKWTGKQPDRIYQLQVESDPDIAAYLRVRGGKTKAGRGIYTRKRPFVLMKFRDIDSALKVMQKEVELVEALSQGHLTLEGSPEYTAHINDFMTRIQELVTGS